MNISFSATRHVSYHTIVMAMLHDEQNTDKVRRQQYAYTPHIRIYHALPTATYLSCRTAPGHYMTQCRLSRH